MWTVHGHQLIEVRHNDVRKYGESHWLRSILLYCFGQVVGSVVIIVVVVVVVAHHETTRLGHGHQSQYQMKLVHRGQASKIVWIGHGPYRAQNSSVDTALRQKGHGVLSRDGNTTAAAAVIGKREDNSKDCVDKIEAIRLFQWGSVVDAVHSFVTNFVVVVVVDKERVVLLEAIGRSSAICLLE